MIVVRICECTPPESAANTLAATAEPMRVRPLRMLVYRAVLKQNPDAKAEQIDEAYDAITSERPLLDWLTSGEFLAFIKAILEIIAAFK